MDLIETTNAIVRLQSRVRQLAPNTNIDQFGQQTINDYNAIASRCNGQTFALRDQIAQLSPITIYCEIIPIATNLSTDACDSMNNGINSIFEALAAAIRTEGARRNRAIVLKSVEPEVLRLVNVIGMRSQTSLNPHANLLEVDIAKFEQELIPTNNPFVNQRIEMAAPVGVTNGTGGGYHALVGRATGQIAAVTVIQGRPGNINFALEFRSPTSGVMSITTIPAPGFIQLSLGNQPPNHIPVHAECVDVSQVLAPGDVRIQFQLGGRIVSTIDRIGTINYPLSDRVSISIEPWNAAKQANNNASFNNWPAGNAQRQPTISLLFNITSSSTLTDYDTDSPFLANVGYYMGTVFSQNSFISSPQNVGWSPRELLAHAPVRDIHWARKIACMIAAYAAKL